MTASSATRPRSHPRRTCVACRTERDKRELVRVVRTPSREVLIDWTGRVAGRGAYLCADGSCWTLALQRDALQRALDVPLPAELIEILGRTDPASVSEVAHGA